MRRQVVRNKGLKLVIYIVMFLGGILALTGCDEKSNREWLEDKFSSELSRVYPTQKLEDLFKEFPGGFEIRQSYYYDDDYIVELELVGDSSTKKIEGELKRVERSKIDGIETTTAIYEGGQLVFSDKAFAEKYWLYDGFLFQRYTINKDKLSKMTLKSKFHSIENDGIELYYWLEDSQVTDYLGIQPSKKNSLEFDGTDTNHYYYYTVSVENKDTGYSFSETVKGANELDKGEDNE